jgi:hypothetical protein
MSLVFHARHSLAQPTSIIRSRVAMPRSAKSPDGYLSPHFGPTFSFELVASFAILRLTTALDAPRPVLCCVAIVSDTQELINGSLLNSSNVAVMFYGLRTWLHNCGAILHLLTFLATDLDSRKCFRCSCGDYKDMGN